MVCPVSREEADFPAPSLSNLWVMVIYAVLLVYQCYCVRMGPNPSCLGVSYHMYMLYGCSNVYQCRVISNLCLILITYRLSVFNMISVK